VHVDPATRVLLIDLGALLPPRYSRLVDFARELDVDPGVLVTLLVGIRPFPPEHIPAPVPDPASARVRCDSGRATWAQALIEIERGFAAAFGREWDVDRYAAHLAKGPGASMRLAPTRAINAIVAAGHPVVAVATGPREFGTAMEGLAPSGVRVVHSWALGIARPDPAVWSAAARAANLPDNPQSLHIVVDAWESGHRLRGAGLTAAGIWDAWAGDAWIDDVTERFAVDRGPRASMGR
jgi:hypothetical protein